MQREEGAGGRKGAEDHRLVKSMCACQKTSFPGDEMGAKRQVNLFCVFFTGVKKKIISQNVWCDEDGGSICKFINSTGNVNEA